jgi:hypothetical protein
MSEETRVRRRSILSAILFIVAIQIFSLYITYKNRPFYVAFGYSSSLAGTSVQGSLVSVLLLLSVVFFSTILLGWLLRKKKTNTFKFLTFFSLAFASFFLTLSTVDIFFSGFKFYSQSILPFEILLSFLPVVLIGFIVFGKGTQKLSLPVLGFLSAEVGSFFASTLPPLTALLLPAAFAIYDMYAVFKGPLRQLLSAAPLGSLQGVATKVSDFTIGLGDNVFYAMLPSVALWYSGINAALLTTIAIDSGVCFTLSLLKRRRILPGLPIPIFLGLLVIILFRLL